MEFRFGAYVRTHARGAEGIYVCVCSQDQHRLSAPPQGAMCQRDPSIQEWWRTSSDKAHHTSVEKKRKAASFSSRETFVNKIDTFA